MSEPRQTIKINEFDPQHFSICNKPPRGHAHKDLAIWFVAQVYKQDKHKKVDERTKRIKFFWESNQNPGKMINSERSSFLKKG